MTSRLGREQTVGKARARLLVDHSPTRRWHKPKRQRIDRTAGSSNSTSVQDTQSKRPNITTTTTGEEFVGESKDDGPTLDVDSVGKPPLKSKVLHPHYFTDTFVTYIHDRTKMIIIESILSVETSSTGRLWHLMHHH